MTSFQIKLLAAILMLCDHIGVVFFPSILEFRYIGRLSFPLFAWLVGQGEKHTKSFQAYLIRLSILGLISQPAYSLLFHSGNLNIFATLALGLLAIRLGKLIGSKYLAWSVFATSAQLINTSYGAYGVLTITLLADFNSAKFSWWLKWFIVNILNFATIKFYPYQLIAILTPVVLILWNGKQGRKLKLFYLFYPLHLLSILAFNLILKIEFE